MITYLCCHRTIESKFFLTSYQSVADKFVVIYGRHAIFLKSIFEMTVSNWNFLFFLNTTYWMNSYFDSRLWINIQGYDKFAFILDMLSTLWYTFRKNIENNGKICGYHPIVLIHLLLFLFCFVYFLPQKEYFLLNIHLLQSSWTYLFPSPFSSSHGTVKIKCITLECYIKNRKGMPRNS